MSLACNDDPEYWTKRWVKETQMFLGLWLWFNHDQNWDKETRRKELDKFFATSPAAQYADEIDVSLEQREEALRGASDVYGDLRWRSHED
jgi:hypothetical protein